MFNSKMIILNPDVCDRSTNEAQAFISRCFCWHITADRKISELINHNITGWDVNYNRLKYSCKTWHWMYIKVNCSFEYQVNVCTLYVWMVEYWITHRMEQPFNIVAGFGRDVHKADTMFLGEANCSLEYQHNFQNKCINKTGCFIS
mgnify:CR=1 FL=1